MVLDVTDSHFGATIASGNDDYSAVSMANDYVASSHIGTAVNIYSGGSVVSHTIVSGDTVAGLYFPAGEYGMSQAIVLHTGYQYVGVSKAATIKSTSTDMSFRLTNASSGSNVTIDGLAFDGRGIIGDNGNESSITIQNCKFTGSYAAGSNNHAILFTAGLDSSSLIQNNEFVDMTGAADTGIFIYSPDQITITGNTFKNVNEGMHLIFDDPAGGRGTGVTISDNDFVLIARVGVEAQGGDSPDFLVSGNRFSSFHNYNGSTYALSIVTHNSDDTHPTIIEDNEISDLSSILDGADAGLIYGIEACGDGTIIRNNLIYGSNVPISAQTPSSEIIVTGNDIYDWRETAGMRSSGVQENGASSIDDSGQINSSMTLPQNLNIQVAFDDIITGDDNAQAYQVTGSDVTKGGVHHANLPVTGPSGYAGRIIIHGFGGNDTITSSSSSDAHDMVFDGGDGNDSLVTGAGNDSVVGGADTDTVSGNNNDTIVTNAGIDSIYGDSDGDSIVAGAGTDFIDGGVGNDSISAGDDNDTVLGNDGNDSLLGNLGADSLDGGTGNDQIGGGDTLDHTVVTSSDLGDTLTGGSGNDMLYGDAANDRILNGASNDGRDTMYGGGGSANIMDYSSRTNAVKIDASGAAVSGETGESDSLDGAFHRLYGGSGNDTLIGGTSIDTLTGNGGNDSLSASNGADVITGDDGNDTILAGLGDDTITGGLGNDSILGQDDDDSIIGDAGADSIIGGLGADWIDGGADNDSIGGGDTLDHTVVTSSDLGDTLTGGSGNDMLYGDGANDRILNGASSDGTDTMYGGGGSANIMDYSSRTNAVKIDSASVSGETGENDSIDTTFHRLYGGGGNDTIVGTTGVDTLTGNGGNDSLVASSGNDVLTGDDGNDTMLGGSNDDNLNGGTGNDSMLGEDGSDSLTGGTGTDNMNGGNGNDWFSAEDGSQDTINGGAAADTDLFFTLSGADKDVDRLSEGDSLNDVVSNMDN